MQTTRANMWKLLTTILVITTVYLSNEIYWYNKTELELTEALERAESDCDSLYFVVDYLCAKMDSLPLGSPIEDSIVISSRYGWRKRPVGGGWQMHAGLDIHAWIYDTIYATGDGKVSSAYWMGGYGRCIVIEHTSGYESTYAHLYRIFVHKGDSVKKGQPIGRAGNSGAVTGPHLHYEVRRHGKPADPLEYIDD